MARNSYVPAPAGVGLRLQHLAEFAASRPEAARLEIHPGNFLANPHARELLEDIARDYPISVHSAGVSVGSVGGVDRRHLKLLPPELAARLAMSVEIVVPLFLFVGLATRLATLPLLGMLIVIQVLVYPQAWVEHLLWASTLVVLLTRGPSMLSLDHLIERALARRTASRSFPKNLRSILMIRRTVLALLATAAFLPLATAGEITPWDASRFGAMQAEGRPILIHVTAPWCPTCRAQHPVVSDLAAASDNPDLVVFEVDFDSQKDVLRQFNVRQQSTLIAFNGAEERARAVGITDRAAITALVAETR